MNVWWFQRITLSGHRSVYINQIKECLALGARYTANGMVTGGNKDGSVSRRGFRKWGQLHSHPWPYPKFEHFGAIFIFTLFFASLHSAYYFFNILIFFIIQIQIFSNLASLGISFLMQFYSRRFSFCLWFNIFYGMRCTHKPQLLIVTNSITCNMKTNAVMIF